jgi:putative ABC transport system permease protein
MVTPRTPHRSALLRKLLRELWQMRVQMLSIALVVATGVMSVVTMRGSYVSLLQARTDYYLQMRFADVWAPLVRAPLALAQRLERIPGVAAVDTRITLLATLDLPDLDIPAQGRFVSLPAAAERPLLNDLLIEDGRYLAPGAPDEVLIGTKFAEARGLGPGDTLHVVINGRAQELQVVGVAASPEFAYAVPPGSLWPEYERFGVFWVSEEFLAPVFDMEGAFNEAVFALDPGANAQAVAQQVDAILEPYGGFGAYPRADQLSHLMLDNELAEIRMHGTVIPAIFLGVAVFLLHQVLERLITTQRGEIAVLKAFGYSDTEVALHYLQFALVPVVLGAGLGGSGGAWLGGGLIGLYRQYFEIPGLAWHFTPSLLALAVGLTLIGAVSGALGAARKAARLPPAEAMRAESPARFRPGPLEAIGIGRLLPAAGRMILRNLERRPLHALMGIVGVALGMAILVIGMFLFDSIEYLLDAQFRRIQREDIALVFKEDVNEAVRFELARLPGVLTVETWRGAPARLRAGHLEKEVVVTALDTDGAMRRIIDVDGKVQPLPASGIVLSTQLAERLGVRAGDALQVEWLDGKRLRTSAQVTDVTADFVGLAAYMNKATLAAATGSHGLISGAYLATAGDSDPELFRALKQVPGISGVNSPLELLGIFDREMARTLTISSSFLLGFAGILAFGVIYNSARIALAERSRELASLRVMGFHREEVAVLLLGEQGLLTVLALPLGCVLGYWISLLITRALESDTFRVPFVADPRTYILAAALILGAALLSTVAVRRRLDRIDIVSVLKTRE